MKNIILICILVFAGKLSAQNYLNITGLNINQIDENHLKVNLKVYSPVYTVYNSYTSNIINDTITLKVCYTVTIGLMVSEHDNYFDIDIPNVSGNYILKVEVYAANPGVCTYLEPYLQDSASLNFTNPFTGTISLSTMDENVSKTEIQIYPNPVKDILNFSEEISSAKITDLSGKAVKQFSASGKSIDVSSLVKGNYMITIVTKTGETITKKFVKN